MEILPAAGDAEEPDLVGKSTEMQTEVWKNLPEELLAPILAHLPWWSNLRLQPVCKSWNSLLRNSELLYKFSPPPPPRLPCCIVRTSCGGAIFNLALRKWHVIPPSLLLPSSQSPDEYQVVAAAGGVFLLEGREEDMGRFLVNPLNKSRKRLPPLPAPEQGNRSTCTILGMVVDRETHMHRIIAEQTEYEEVESPSAALRDPLGATKFCEIYVYDMNTKTPSWEIATTLQSEIDLCLEIENAVFVANDLYILMVQPFGWCWMYRVFKALHTSWSEVPAEIAIDLGHVHLFEHRGSLMLVGGTDVMKSDKNLTVDIWRLDMVKLVWEHMLTMPEELIKKLCALPENGIFYRFDVEGDYACFINPFTEVTITCDIVKKAWGWIDRHEYSNNFEYIDDLIFLFQPRLDIVL
ncbi:unnamed protein product [Calypogeia fissa]